MTARGWSYWSRNKLEILQGYLPAFNQAAKSVEERIYLDLMAGEPENFDRDTGQKFDGSARIALFTTPSFTRFAFGELPPRAARIKADLEARHPGAPFRVYPGDCNVTVKGMLADLNDVRWAPMFAFLDQQAAELRRAVGPRAPLRRLRRAVARMEERALLGSVRALVVALDACCRQRWHVVPGPAIELAAVGLWRPATPLLEEERDVGAQALVADVFHPLRLHRSGMRARLATGDHPVDLL